MSNGSFRLAMLVPELSSPGIATAVGSFRWTRSLLLLEPARLGRQRLVVSAQKTESDPWSTRQILAPRSIANPPINSLTSPRTADTVVGIESTWRFRRVRSICGHADKEQAVQCVDHSESSRFPRVLWSLSFAIGSITFNNDTRRLNQRKEPTPAGLSSRTTHSQR